ncbi:unnamed protein product [Mytilus coruscus]|uniref:Uncharacterized protein n=1 Tax=Mytilus coruscus TaxID=42192 RepID=A0A6J8ASW5_MYTCO|nr:unnamed protein product [Mytilus coruscus]
MISQEKVVRYKTFVTTCPMDTQKIRLLGRRLRPHPVEPIPFASCKEKNLSVYLNLLDSRDKFIKSKKYQAWNYYSDKDVIEEHTSKKTSVDLAIIESPPAHVTSVSVIKAERQGSGRSVGRPERQNSERRKSAKHASERSVGRPERQNSERRKSAKQGSDRSVVRPDRQVSELSEVMPPRQGSERSEGMPQRQGSERKKVAFSVNEKVDDADKFPSIEPNSRASSHTRANTKLSDLTFGSRKSPGRKSTASIDSALSRDGELFHITFRGCSRESQRRYDPRSEIHSDYYSIKKISESPRKKVQNIQKTKSAIFPESKQSFQAILLGSQKRMVKKFDKGNIKLPYYTWDKLNRVSHLRGYTSVPIF